MLRLQRSIVPFHARLKFDIAAGVGSSAWEPISPSPPGEPPRVPRHRLPGLVLSGDDTLLTPSPGHSQERESHVTKTEQTLTDSFSLDATDGVRLNPFGRNGPVTVRAFLFQNQEKPREVGAHCASATDDRICPEVNGRAT